MPEHPGGAAAILVVDDQEPVRRGLARILARDGYRCDLVGSVDEARHALRLGTYKLVLCDIMMPDEHGMALLRHARSCYPCLPVVMVSGVTEPTIAATAISLGAYGYVTKPFEANQVLIEVANALLRAKIEAENISYRTRLEDMVTTQTDLLRETVEQLRASEASLRRVSEDTINSLARAIEGRDYETSRHIERMSRYAAILAGRCGLSDEACANIRLASAMHDVGKIGVPDSILLKPGSVTPDEFEIIKQHSELGFQILERSEQPLLVMAALIARTHHERWDGTGYPHALAGEAIAIEGRIAAVADVFDALVSRRVYKPAFTVERSLEIMRQGRGTSFDPDVLDQFLDHAGEAVTVLDMFPDAA
ncbi:MAG: HD domain-containing phosphohydrolase [Acidimicrobiales bacterium]|jgi:putative two-component system response regulator